MSIVQINGGHIPIDSQVAEWIAIHDPDFVFVVQGSDSLLRSELLLEKYPFRSGHPHHDIFSKTRLWDPVVLFGEAHFRNEYIAEFLKVAEIEGQRVLLGGPSVPSSRNHSLWYRAQQTLCDVADSINSIRNVSTMPVITAGDFNSTPFGAGYQNFKRRSGLVDSNPRLFRVGTWPANAPNYARVGIDHVFISREISLVKHSVGPNLGGDHRPLLVELKLPAQINGGHAGLNMGEAKW
ncbi:MAG: endonuclease/exonuclease/phosphatase family protein [Pseudomonadota bacterium]